MTEKKYIKWFCKEIVFGNGWSAINLNINLDELNLLTPDKYGNVRLTLFKRKEPWQYWDTHYLVINEFESSKEDNKKASSKAKEDDFSELPF